MKILAKTTLIAIGMVLAVTTTKAQSGTNSPYSQFGFGEITGEQSGFNRAMNGLGIAFNDGSQVNYINPASYAKTDSLTFLFDAGLSLQLTNFSENGRRRNANNANFDYVTMAFRAAKHLGMSIGVVPITKIGYNYSQVSNIGDIQDAMQYSASYTGSGGLRQVYIGAGWEPLRNLSIGANIGYLWGDYTHTLVNAYSDNTVNALSKTHTADISSYKIDFGLQYATKLSKKNTLTIGATYGIGHKLNADARCEVTSINSATQVTNTTTDTIKNAISIPTTFGAGIMWNHNNRLQFGIDYTMQQWSKESFPVYDANKQTQKFYSDKNYFDNRHKITIGGEYCRNKIARNFFQRIRYRAGFGYATSYVNIAGKNGPKEISATIGFGIPIVNGYNSRSVLNISGGWVRQEAKGMLTENTYRIGIGITFNERWFQKWKFD